MNDKNPNSIKKPDSTQKRNSIKKRGALLSAIVIISIMLIYAGVYLWLLATDAAPKGLILVISLIPLAVIIGVLIALKERFKEIEGGEEDDSINY